MELDYPVKPKQIKTIRMRLGMTVKEFATEVGVSNVTIFYWESGKYQPSSKWFKRLFELAKTVQVNGGVNEKREREGNQGVPEERW